MASYDTVLLERRGEFAQLTLNRPKSANTINGQLIADVDAALDELEKDAEVRVILLTGAGERHFCGGADLREAGRLVSGGLPAAGGRDFIRHFEQVPQPVIAVINGAAMGGGCEIALACDFRLMAEEARIGVPEIRFGALPGGGGTQRLPRIVGLARAKELVLTGRHLTAQQALDIGLVHAIAPRPSLMERAEELARELADKAAYALAAGKTLLNEALDTELDEGLALERRMIAEMGSPEERRAARERAMQSSATYKNIFSRES